jgi:SNF2 family DNA or RNA helicase
VYAEKTTSLRHQWDAFEFCRDLTEYALFWAQGVGKTKPTIDKFGHLYTQGRVRGLFVVAPSNVAPNWVNDELPKHMPDALWNATCVHLFQSSKFKLKRSERQRKELLAHIRGPVILVMSFDAMRTKHGKAFARRFMLKFPCMGVVDESQRIKKPRGKTAVTVVASGKYMPYKMLLSGTPVTNGILDLYMQFKFLDDDFWARRGLEPFAVFKKHFAVYRTRAEALEEDGWDPGYDQYLGPKNVEEMAGYIKLIGHRLTKESAGIFLPPKVYTKRYFDLTPDQMRMYVELEEDLITHLPKTDEESDEVIVEVLDKLTLGTRHAQITCGYVAVEAGEPVQFIGDTNPRLECFKDTFQDHLDGKSIVWCRFTKDVDLIMKTLTEMGRKPVRYDGQVGVDEREANKKAFQEGDATDFVAKQQSAAAGVTLHAAKYVYYYSQSYNWEHRAQSEDRAHRIGLKHSVLYIDFVANGTIDNKILRALRKNHQFSQQLLGDTPTEWI